MIGHKEYLALSSEVRELESMLASIPEENVLERMGLESRLEEARAVLAGAKVEQPASKARLLFRGRPVWGTHGIVASFASKTVDAFAEAVAAVAAGIAENLRYMGPIPDRQKNELLITGTAIGSFGFEFEIPPPKENENIELFSEASGAEVALEKVQALLEAAVSGTDDDVAELVDEIHPRAVKKVSDFLEQMSRQEAWCALEFKEHTFRFRDLKQLRQSMERIQEDNIHENKETYRGELQGVLPKGRAFEFRIADRDEVIRGKLGPDMEEEKILMLNQDFLYKPVKITLNIVQVGQGRPRFTLESIEDIQEDS
ncbi:hypothetical protein [Thiolapillus sp.]